MIGQDLERVGLSDIVKFANPAPLGLGSTLAYASGAPTAKSDLDSLRGWKLPGLGQR
jgi:hypothetical protein